MKTLQNSLTLVGLLQLVSLARGECLLPGPWTEGQWFSHYDNTLTWLVQYSREVYMYSVADLQKTVTAGFACQHSERLDGRDYMLLLNNDRLYCLKVSSGTDNMALLIQMTTITQTALYARDCVGRLDSADIGWQIRYPFTKLAQACPFHGNTLYQAIVHINNNQNCEGDNKSNVKVKGSGEVVLNTCVKTNNYAFPLSGATLRCLSEVPGAEVDGGDNVLLLGYDDGPNTRFYCARHSTENGVILLSLDTRDKDKANCKRGTSARTSTDGHVALTLTAVSGDTCSCVFGSCVDEGTTGLKRCQCQTGYTGLHCETELPQGRCQASNGPCENEAVCQNVAPSFYYCDCPYGFIGVRCQVPTACQPNPCLHEGVCTPFGPGYQCDCPAPYVGDRCQQNAELKAFEPTTATSGNNTLIIVLVTLFGGIIIAAIGIAIMVCQRRLRRKEAALPVNPESDMPKQSSSMQAWRPEYMDTYNSRLAHDEEKAVDSD